MEIKCRCKYSIKFNLYNPNPNLSSQPRPNFKQKDPEQASEAYQDKTKSTKSPAEGFIHKNIRAEGCYIHKMTLQE